MVIVMLVSLWLMSADAHAIEGPINKCYVQESDLQALTVAPEVRKTIGQPNPSTYLVQRYRNNVATGQPSEMPVSDFAGWQQVVCPKFRKNGTAVERGYEKRAKDEEARRRGPN
jgi:hypothetical protein